MDMILSGSLLPVPHSGAESDSFTIFKIEISEQKHDISLIISAMVLLLSHLLPWQTQLKYFKIPPKIGYPKFWFPGCQNGSKMVQN